MNLKMEFNICIHLPLSLSLIFYKRKDLGNKRKPAKAQSLYAEECLLCNINITNLEERKEGLAKCTRCEDFVLYLRPTEGTCFLFRAKDFDPFSKNHKKFQISGARNS